MICLQAFMSSCFTKIALNSMGVFDKEVSKKYIINGTKKLVFFEMHHVGKQAFYDDVKHDLDSLLGEGYKLFFEGVGLDKSIDSLTKDTLFRKVRKITGMDMNAISKNNGYLDTVNNKLAGKKTSLIKKNKLVNQPPRMYPKDDTIRTKRVDENYLSLVIAVEKKFGPIVLEPVDYNTKFGEKYKVPKNKTMRNYFIQEYRNEKIADAIIRDTASKIILLYGKKHLEGIFENLKKSDANYKMVDNLP